MKTLDELLEMLYLSDNITQIRQQIINKIDLLEDKQYVKSIAGHLLPKYENFNREHKIDNENTAKMLFLLEQIKNTGLIDIKSFKEFLIESRFDIKLLFIYLIEILYGKIYPGDKDSVRHYKLLNEFNIKLYKILELIELKDNNSLLEILLLFSNTNIDDVSYKMIFAYTLRQMPIEWVNEFLEYHRKEHQKINSDYQSFLNELMLDYENIFLPKTKKKVEKWIAINYESKEEIKGASQKRQTLALYYIFNQLKLFDAPVTKKARFIQFLTTKSYDNIKDFLYALKKDETIAEPDDLEFVQKQFEALGIENIVSIIKVSRDKKEKNDTLKRLENEEYDN